ncbi:MAG: transcription termination/antitermination protein NusG [Candidatus Gracilibacteria bacterium]|nr:transcription termination/antitermination protein NusG [Candidatus Gracilibacteria bacterium]MDD4531007.1 transcription termination/antitermination protein NusG [Candidatus Gracilibacteria bacterium]
MLLEQLGSQNLSETRGDRYVIRVISGTEEAVREALLQRRVAFNLEDYILDVFVPLYDSVSIRAGGVKIKRKKNIFPGYILVNMIVTNESWYIVRNTPNVTGFLGAGNIPVPVKGEELERLKGVVEVKKEEFVLNIMPGDYVSIIKGPFEGNEGKVTEVNESKGIIKVIINFFGRDTSMELDFSCVKVKK